MRISDWSSDVCSSDLLLAKFASADEQACETLRRFLAEPLHHAFDDRLDCQCGQRRLLRRLPDHRIPADECERGVPAPDRDGKVEGRDDANGTDRVPLFGEPVRSEEHTSELQSLMRTSYA